MSRRAQEKGAMRLRMRLDVQMWCRREPSSQACLLQGIMQRAKGAFYHKGCRRAYRRACKAWEDCKFDDALAEPWATLEQEGCRITNLLVDGVTCRRCEDP
eukprot:3785056-Karenia_brevis.AAC.1